MKVGDLVVCTCDAPVWYKGIPGLLVGFERFGTVQHVSWFQDPNVRYVGDPLVKYGDKTIRLTKSSLTVISS